MNRSGIQTGLRAVRADSVHQHDVVLERGAGGRLQGVHVRGSGHGTASLRAGRSTLYPRHAAGKTTLSSRRFQKETCQSKYIGFIR